MLPLQNIIKKTKKIREHFYFFKSTIYKNKMLSEEKLIKKLKRYSISAQQELYERYAVMFKKICLKYASQEADADDIMQDAFMKIFKKIETYNFEGSFEGWMKRIVINLALDNYKKKKKDILNFDDIQEYSIIDESKTSVELIDRKDINEDEIDYNLIEQANFSVDEMMVVVNRLKEEFKIVFQLYFFENLKHKEIADILDIPEKTSRTRLLRARAYVQLELYKMCINRVSI